MTLTVGGHHQESSMQVTTADIKAPAALVYRSDEHLLILRTGLVASSVVLFLGRLLRKI